ncbi:hypothetical protein B0H21DRAFT_685467 [Amylocystis lapponica]|nr:hypothetical protein B0H21DRAFT_685467 [Amylocystis lapponica]
MDPPRQLTHDGVHDLDGQLDNLQIADSTVVVIADDSESNPWQEPPDKLEPTDSNHDPRKHVLRTPDPSLLDNLATQGLAAEQEDTTPVHTNEEVLLEFDPLASPDEKAAREAWANSLAHPPPPRADIAATREGAPSPPPKETATSHPSAPSRTSSPIPAFPSLAALARTFSIPLGHRQRPRSLDIAASVPSPATLSSFAQQQSAPATRHSVDDGTREIARSNGSGQSTPAGREEDLVARKDKENSSFDFQRFLDQMKLKGAEPVAKYLRSFLGNFAKRTFTVSDQVKLINDFLNFISARMRETDVWRNATDVEFDNAMEGMEKLVMNRLYEFTFTPQVARMIPPRPITVDDLDRDRVLSQRIALFGWIEPKHLDVPEGPGSDGFVMFAQQELLKINHYKAPRDKLICILNCCKVIFGLLRHLRKEEGADMFVPILIFVVLKANPRHLLSNVEFINRFRNPTKLQSEAGYYLSSLMGAVSFIETMDHTSLSNITQEEFERNVEDMIQSLPTSGTQTPEYGTPSLPMSPSSGSFASSHTGEESAQLLALPTPAQTLSDDARRFLQKTGDTISKPLSTISRIFNEVLDGAEESFFAPLEQDHTRPVPQTPQGTGEESAYTAPLQTPYKPRVRRVHSPLSSARSSGSFQFGPATPDDTPTRPQGPSIPYTHQPLNIGPSQTMQGQPPRAIPRDLLDASSPHVSRTPTPNLDLAGLQDEIDRAHEKAAVAARETLRQIFPTTDPEIVGWVLEANEGDLGKSIEALLEMTNGT